MVYRATRRDKKHLKRYKQGKSIGFTMRSSLKAKGLIPRANGTRRVSKKYRGGEKPPGSVGSVSSGSSSGSSGFRSFSQMAVNIGRRNILKPFANTNWAKVGEEDEARRLEECQKDPYNLGEDCECTDGLYPSKPGKIFGTINPGCERGLSCMASNDRENQRENLRRGAIDPEAPLIKRCQRL